MGEPALKIDAQSNEQIVKRKVQISGLTENWRLKDLEQRKVKLAKKGWVFEEYVDAGMTKSYAIFKRPINIKDPIHPAAKIIGVMIVLFIVVGLFSRNSDDRKQVEILQVTENQKADVAKQSESNAIQKRMEEKEKFILEANKKLNDLMISKVHPLAKRRLNHSFFIFIMVMNRFFFVCLKEVHVEYFRQKVKLLKV